MPTTAHRGQVEEEEEEGRRRGEGGEEEIPISRNPPLDYKFIRIQ